MNIIYYKNIVFLFLILSSTSLSLSNTVDDSLEYANALYMKGEYEDAIELYKYVLDTEFCAAELYYNMGNAYYKTYDIPNAIFYYEKAHRLNPKDKEILHNLTIAQALTVDKTDVIPEFFLKRWIHNVSIIMPLRLWALVSLVFFALLLISILVYLATSSLSRKKLFFGLSILFLCMTLVSYGLSRELKSWMLDDSAAIVFTPTVNIQSSPDKNSMVVFVLHEGTKVWIIDSIGSWKEIILSDGKQGWIEENDLKTLNSI